ncbi:hypothetical protein NC651_002899 [Populus alba x Populus x berolinensis]|nr:hypothetical protein NC651_002899 [Populus alba x Populus x berolinensis]
MKVGWDIFFSLPYTLKFIFNELDIQCKGQKEMLVKINIKDVFLGGSVEQTRKHYERAILLKGNCLQMGLGCRDADSDIG